MESFQLIQPSRLLAPYVKHYWFLTTDNVMQGSERIIPSGQMCLMFHRGTRLFSSSDDAFQPRAFLSGQGTDYTDLIYSGSVDMISIVFQPAGARAFFNVPMIELNGQNIAVDELSDIQLSDLQKQLTDTYNPFLCVSFIEQFLLKRLYRQTDYNQKRINTIIHSIHNGQQDIDILAQTACLGYKQFKRIFSDYIGANPKDYLRVIRFQKALYILQTQPDISLTQLSFECGYYDQPHLIKDFKTFSGYTPTEYMSLCAPYSDYFS